MLARDLSELERIPTDKTPHAFFRAKSRRCIIKVASGPGVPRSMSSVQSTVCSRNTAPVRSSVCLSVQEIGFGDFVQIAVHVLSFACGNAPAAHDTQVQKTDAPFLSSDHPTLSPSVSPVFSCHFLPCRVIVSRKDRC